MILTTLISIPIASGAIAGAIATTVIMNKEKEKEETQKEETQVEEKVETDNNSDTIESKSFIVKLPK